MNRSGRTTPHQPVPIFTEESEPAFTRLGDNTQSYDTDVAVRLWHMSEAIYESRATAYSLTDLKKGMADGRRLQ
jgi:hypothetical protein